MPGKAGAAKLVTVFGGSGFIGRHLVNRLARDGYRVRVAVRDPEAAHFLKPLGQVGQIGLMRASVLDETDIARAIDGADWVVNLVGILVERGPATFDAIHAQAPGAIARFAAEKGAERLVHVSALGADPDAEAAYARSKAAGEAAVLKAYPSASILRPSVIFGPEDEFFNMFATVARFSGVFNWLTNGGFLPVITRDGPRFDRKAGGIDWFGSGGPKFQPVYVKDVAEAIMACLTAEGEALKARAGKIFELGGPEVLSMLDVMRRISEYTERRNILLPFPIGLARFKALFWEMLPKPPLTRDQVRLLETDNVVSGVHPDLADLGIAPEPIAAQAPHYLSRFRPHYRHTILRRQKGLR